MMHNRFDEEYYVIDTDGADNHPMLAWGETSSRPFLYIEEIEKGDLDLPIEVEFDTPYPKHPKMADGLQLGSALVVSERVKQLFEKTDIPKLQFFPVTIITGKKQKIDEGYYILHCWNGFEAIDKNSYEGDPVDEDGEILTLIRFSLDTAVMEATPMAQRLVFRMQDFPSLLIVHKSVKEVIEAEHATGFKFYRIDKWSSSAIFE